MLQNKPLVETSENWPNEQGLYSMSGIKRYMRAKYYTNDMTDQAIFQLQNDKQIGLEHVMINNKEFGNYPYFYKDLSESEKNILAKEYESYKKTN